MNYYTYEQLEEMRKAIRILHGRYYYPPNDEDLPTQGRHISNFGIISDQVWVRGGGITKDNEEVERYLLTYITASTLSSNLVEAATYKSEKWKAMWEAYDKEEKRKKELAEAQAAEMRAHEAEQQAELAAEEPEEGMETEPELTFKQAIRQAWNEGKR